MTGAKFICLDEWQNKCTEEIDLWSTCIDNNINLSLIWQNKFVADSNLTLLR